MLLAMIVLSALATLSALTVVSVQGGIATASTDRFHAIATYAAESGAAAGMDFLRKNVSGGAGGTGWTAWVSASNAAPQQPTGLPGNNQAVGSPGNQFSSDIGGWYSVQILNNRDDTGYATGLDNDKRVIIRSTGYGPNGAVATLEWEISALNATTASRPCSVYSQRGESEDDSGRNDCLKQINTSDTATFRPGG